MFSRELKGDGELTTASQGSEDESCCSSASLQEGTGAEADKV